MSAAPDDLLTPWIGGAFRHVNATRGHDVLDFSHAGLYGKNRWNIPGEPTLYLAGDIGVAIAEWGRRFPASYPAAAKLPVVRDVFQLHLRLSSVLDLRSRESMSATGHHDAPDIFRDINIARAVARQMRTTTRAQAMLVPSIAFLDDLTRWNLVVFLEKVPTDQQAWITKVDRIGPLTWQPDRA
jgi:RES domain-containing protein